MSKEVDEKYEAMMADIGGRPLENEWGVDPNYEAWRASLTDNPPLEDFERE